MTTLHALVADVYFRIPENWDVWTDFCGTRYQREGVNILAVDRFGKGWRFDTVRGEWIARMRKSA